MTPDEDFAAALAEEVVRPAWFIFVDLDGDPIRVTTSGYEVTFTDTGDAELDGQVFSPIDPSVVDVSEVVQREGGSEPVTVTLSGMLDVDQDVLDVMGDPAKYQGRVCRLWVGARDATGAFAGVAVPYYTGWMMRPDFRPGPDSQTIALTVVAYESLLQDAPNRTWLDQGLYDPADTSAAATLAAVNGAGAGPGAGIAPGIGPSPGSIRRYESRGLVRPL